mgnify:CR=1 FL=1
MKESAMQAFLTTKKAKGITSGGSDDSGGSSIGGGGTGEDGEGGFS